MQPTHLLYLEDFTTLTAPAKVLALQEDEEKGKVCLILDTTIFYPQGGGQPYDTGSIKGDSGTFIVQEVRFLVTV